MKKIVVLTFSLLSLSAVADIKLERSKVTYLAEQTFTQAVNLSGGFELDGLSDVTGDALCVSSLDVIGTCGIAVFTTSVSTPAVVSPATGGSDPVVISPAGVAGLTINEAGDVHINRVVTSHGACAADADTGRIENYGVGDTISICACEKTAAATYAWKALSGTGTC